MDGTFLVQEHKLLTVMTENRQFHCFIIVTMMLTDTHDSAIRTPNPPTNTDVYGFTAGSILWREIVE